MQIRNFLHKGLRHLYEDNSAKTLSAASADKLRNMLAVLDDFGEHTGTAELSDLEGTPTVR